MTQASHNGRNGFVRAPDHVRWSTIPGERIAVRVYGEETGGAYALVEGLISPGGGPPPHRHSREDELICVVEGTLRFFLGHESFEAREGSVVHIPKGVVHAFRNETNTDAKALLFLSPAGLERAFEEFDGQPPQKIATIAERFGTTFEVE